MERPAVTVVVPTRDRPERLVTCLGRLRTALGPDDEIVVVDSASRDAEAVRRAAGSVRLLRCEQPGASRARNAGWRAAGTDLVVFVDDDVLVMPGWAAALAAAAADGAGFVAGRTVAPEGSVGEAATVTWGRPAEVIDLTTRGAVAASNNLLVRREALAAMGGFDERLGPGTWLAAGEDLELLDRLLAAGWTGRYAAEAVVVHEQWRDTAERRRLQYAYGKGMGARVAAAARRDPARAAALSGELVRLGGVRTLLRRVLRRAPAAVGARSAPAEPVEDVSGWVGPLLWRAGALVGLVVGLAVLRPWPAGHGSAGQVPAVEGPLADG